MAPHTGRILNCVENIGSKCDNSHITSNLLWKNIEIICTYNIHIYTSIPFIVSDGVK